MTPPDSAVAVLVRPAGVTAQEPLENTLRRVVQTAVDLVGAQYGAIGLTAPDGRELDRFVVVGMGDDGPARIGRLPTGHGVLGLLTDRPAALRLDDIGVHPAAVGFPPGHPPMRSFLGVPVCVGDAAVGTLYLTDKRTGGPFTDADADAVQALAAVAGPAIENARLAERAELRRAWVEAGTEAVTALLSGADATTVLRDVAAEVATLTDADMCGILVPTSDDDALAILAAVGPGAEHWEGVHVRLTGTHIGDVHRSGVATALADIAAEPLVARRTAINPEISEPYGPSLIVPLGGAPPLGMIVTMRARGRPLFEEGLLGPVTGFARQTALALALAGTQARERRLQVQADRDRIARDLHDHVVQRIFATALSLDRLSRSLESTHPAAAERLSGSVDDLDDTIGEIRAAIFELHLEDERQPASLGAQLTDVVRQVTEAHALRRDVRLRGPVDELPAELVPDLLAVARELVTNVVRHAAASRVTVTLTAADEVRLVVTDDGVGLHPASVRSGLTNLAERAERRGGRLTATARGSGTQVRWSVPRP